MIHFTLKHPRATQAMVGPYLPHFWSEEDPRPAKVQANEKYVSGWNKFEGFRMTEHGLEYPGDPPTLLLAEAKLREETIQFYQHSWVAIVQPDGSFEVCRMD